MVWWQFILVLAVVLFLGPLLVSGLFESINEIYIHLPNRKAKKNFVGVILVTIFFAFFIFVAWLSQ